MVEMSARGGAQGRTVFERPAGEVEVQELEPRTAAAVRIEVAPADMPRVIGAAFAEVAGAVAQAGIPMGGEPFARYVEFGQDRIVAEVGFPVTAEMPAVGRVHGVTLPGGPVASIVHVGPYDRLVETYDRLQAWFAETGKAPGAPMWEVYWSEPVGDPATWRTEILWPIA